jgi:AbrB family looped-hinge helix DNA binding protein
MKSVGIVRKIDELGRIVIPKEVRDVNGWNTGTPMEMFTTEDGLCIRKFVSSQEKNTVIDKLVEVLGISIDPKILKAVEDAIGYIEEN